MFSHHSEAEIAEDYCEFKSLILRKLYHYVRRHHPGCRKDLKERLITECHQLFQGELNLKLMIRFIRSKLEGMQ